MHRLFVAIRPAGPVRARLLAAMGGVGGARWQSDEQLHLTLRFIGDVDRHQAVDVHAALGAVHHPGFEIALAGVGSFESRGEPATLWAAVAPQDRLRTLHNKVDQAIARVGIAPDRPTSPSPGCRGAPGRSAPFWKRRVDSPARLSAWRISASTKAG